MDEPAVDSAPVAWLRGGMTILVIRLGHAEETQSALSVFYHERRFRSREDAARAFALGIARWARARTRRNARSLFPELLRVACLGTYDEIAQAMPPDEPREGVLPVRLTNGWDVGTDALMLSRCTGLREDPIFAVEYTGTRLFRAAESTVPEQALAQLAKMEYE